MKKKIVNIQKFNFHIYYACIYRRISLFKYFLCLLRNLLKHEFLGSCASKSSLKLFIFTILIFSYLPVSFAISNDPIWNEGTIKEAFLLENRRGPNPVHNLSPINPALGSPSGRLESDGGSATGNYHMDIPIVDLPGRGMDLNLTAKFNSQIWSKTNDPDSEMYLFNKDRDWPIPGLTIGFGKLFFPGDGYFINDNGSRQELSPSKREIINGQITGKLIANFIDGTHGRFECTAASFGCDNSSPAYIYLENGKKIELITVAPQSGTGIYTFYPIRISDQHGNFIKIDYRTDSSGKLTPPNIYRITDTVGRVVQFHYDESGLPIAITGPNYGSGDRVYARFYYGRINLNVLIPYVGNPNATKQFKFEYPILNAIYFPGNQSGYIFFN